MITQREERLLEDRCRLELRKDGKRLAKRRERGVICWRPLRGAYKITDATEQTEATGYPFTLPEIMTICGGKLAAEAAQITA